MGPTYVLAANDQHPPNVNHSVVFSAFVLKIVQHSCNVAVAIVTADVVHALAVGTVGLGNTLIELSQLILCNIQLQVLMS